MNPFRCPFGRVLGLGISLTQSLYLHRKIQDRETRTYIHDSNRIRTHDSCVGAVKTHVIDHTVFVVQSCKAYAEFSFPCAVEQTKEETRVWIPLACFIAIPLCSAVKFAQLCATGPVPEAVHKGLFFSLLFF